MKRDYPEFKKVVEDAKKPSNLIVESALFKRALGYSYKEKVCDVVPVFDKDTGLVIGTKEVLTQIKEKHMPGEVRVIVT